MKHSKTHKLNVCSVCGKLCYKSEAEVTCNKKNCHRVHHSKCDKYTKTNSYDIWFCKICSDTAGMTIKWIEKIRKDPLEPEEVEKRLTCLAELTEGLAIQVLVIEILEDFRLRKNLDIIPTALGHTATEDDKKNRKSTSFKLRRAQLSVCSNSVTLIS